MDINWGSLQCQATKERQKFSTFRVASGKRTSELAHKANKTKSQEDRKQETYILVVTVPEVTILMSLIFTVM